MTHNSSSNPLAPHIQGASLVELQNMLKDLRRARSVRKQAGKKSPDQTGIRVELPVGCDKQSADGLLKKLSIAGDATIQYIENPKLIGGIRVFIGDTLYDGSFTTLTQNINH